MRPPIAILFMLGFALLFPSPVYAQELAKTNEWIQTYYRGPDPTSVVPKLKRANILNGSQGGGLGLIGFLSAVFEQNPSRLQPLIGEWGSFEAAEQAFIVRSLWFSGTPEAAAFIKRVWSDRLLTSLGEDLSKQKPGGSGDAIFVRHPGDLDFLWGRFFATGRAAPVMKIIEALRPGTEKQSAAKHNRVDLMIHGAAVWSLTSNAGRYDRVLDIAKNALRRADRDTAATLREIIAKAESRRVKVE